MTVNESQKRTSCIKMKKVKKDQIIYSELFIEFQIFKLKKPVILEIGCISVFKISCASYF